MTDALVIVRIMRILVAVGIFGEVEEQNYVATPISKTWRAPSLTGCTKHLSDTRHSYTARINADELTCAE